MNAATVAAFDAATLLESLRRRGAQVSIKGTGAAAWLHVAPRGVLSDDERANLRRYKREIIAALNTSDDVPTVAHRWQSAATEAATPETSAPNLDDLARAIAGAQRGAWLCPTPELLEIWKELEAFHGRSIQSRELAAMAMHADASAEREVTT